MIKKAFTLIELIFVIVIMGIMAGIASTSFKPTYLIDDSNFIIAKIKEAQFLGIGYEHLNFDGTSSVFDDKSGCIEIKKSSLEENATNKNEINYKIHSLLSGNLNNTKICFDSKGRPHKDDFDGDLLTEQKILTLRYSDKERNITIEPITGYVIVNY